jgi:hypothetical protein
MAFNIIIHPPKAPDIKEVIWIAPLNKDGVVLLQELYVEVSSATRKVNAWVVLLKTWEAYPIMIAKLLGRAVLTILKAPF